LNNNEISTEEIKSPEYYSEYIDNRKPNDFGNNMISRWHKRILMKVTKECGLNSGQRFLEIGPGHGQLAQHITAESHHYFFVDLSKSVYDQMLARGFEGFYGDISQLPLKKYDVIWISHALEHCPDWLAARDTLMKASQMLNENGRLVVISPDILSWKFQFWNVDFSHGYPTSLRNVAQLMSDLGLEVKTSRYHRGGRFNLIGRSLPAVITKIPHTLIDQILTPKRRMTSEGLFYSWKTVFGFRQILVVASPYKNLQSK
jgi:SAM-dependent methyltransferase